MGDVLMIHRKKSVRYISLSFDKPNPKNMARDLQDTVDSVRNRRNTIQYQRARAKALKLMGIPDLHTKKFVRKHRKHVQTIINIVNGVSDYIYESAYNINGSFAYGEEERINVINNKIRSANAYRVQNPLLLAQMDDLMEIDLELLKSRPNFFLIGKDSTAEVTPPPTTSYNKREMKEAGMQIVSVSGVPMIVGCRKCGLDMVGHIV
jgi:hypothetical protein